MTKLRVLALSTVLTAVVLAGTYLAGRSPHNASAPQASTAHASTPQASAPQASAQAGARVDAASVLRAWDQARSQAWARGDARTLRRLYAEDSDAGRADVRHLKRWEAAGLRVDGLVAEVLDLEVLAQEPGRWVLRVTDRVTGGVAVGGGVRIPLPDDQASTRTVVLVEAGSGWRVGSVV
ncbi:MAG: hypothetical protein ACSLEW_06960 [Nocardioides sp.]